MKYFKKQTIDTIKNYMLLITTFTLLFYDDITSNATLSAIIETTGGIVGTAYVFLILIVLTAVMISDKYKKEFIHGYAKEDNLTVYILRIIADIIRLAIVVTLLAYVGSIKPELAVLLVLAFSLDYINTLIIPGIKYYEDLH